MKIILAILGIFGMALLAGCSSGSPIDAIVPVPVPFMMEEYLQHDVPNWKNITTLAIVKAEKHEIEWRNSLNQLQYGIVTKSTQVTISAGETWRDNILTGLAALGLGGTPMAFLAGAKKKRKGDLSPEEFEKEKIRVGLMHPDEFKEKELNKA